MPTQAKNITVSITLVVTIVVAMGTTIFTLFRDNNEAAIAQLQAEIKELKDGDGVLHRRISDVSERQRTMETNLAGYNAKLDDVRSDVSEIKSDIKEISKVDITTALKNALRDWNRPD